MTLLSVTATWLIGRRMMLGRRAKIALHSMMAMMYTQVILGIATLVSFDTVEITMAMFYSMLALMVLVCL